MCGVAGLFTCKSETQLDTRERLQAMARAQQHRGPDDCGVYMMPDMSGGLANRRLAIRDLSSAGHMPMSNGTETVWITYNGEIYNTAEVRAALSRRGYQFRSRSDAEVVLHAYEAWGEQSVNRLEGIFAFGVLDMRGEHPVVFLARDPLGVKPLYYSRDAQAVAFASELKGIMPSGVPNSEMDATALVAYLLLGSVPPPMTIYGNVHALEPGCTLRIALHQPLVAQPKPYWRLPTSSTVGPDRSGAVDTIRQALLDIVASQMVGDVPVGAFLSGGLDSSSVLALMRAATPGVIRTCSMSFEGASQNEGGFAKSIAESVGAEHHERTVTVRDLGSNLDGILWAMDQPSVDAVNTYFVSQTARDAGLTVTLSGLGGDELFGGYPSTFRGVPHLVRATKTLQRIPRGVEMVSAAIGTSPWRHRWSKLDDSLRRPADAANAYLARRGLFSPSEVERLVGSDIWERARETFEPSAYIAARAGAEDDTSRYEIGPYGWITRAELGTYTSNQLLRDTDAMSMAHSLEVRVPLLDRRLIEVVLRLPDSLRAGGAPKWLLRDALGSLLPAAVRVPRRKQGFTVPLDVWMTGPLREQVRAMVFDGSRAAGLRGQEAGIVWRAFLDRRMHWSRPWALAVLANPNIFAVRSHE